jgi:general secretion pathway protein K
MNNEKGMVLIIVMMLLGVIAGLAISLISGERFDVKRTEVVLSQSQSIGYLKGAQIWAKSKLMSPLYQQDSPQLRQFPMVMPEPQPKIPGVEIKAILYDAQGQYYNINNLSSAENVEGFKSFLNKSVLNSSQRGSNNSAANLSENIERFVTEIANWISASAESSPVSDSYYMNLPNPSRVAHQLFVSPHELSGLQYCDQNLAAIIMPYLIALPEMTPINVNSVNMNSASILMTLSPGLDWYKAQQIVAARERLKDHEFDSTYGFLSQSDVKAYNIPDAKISTKSSYFLLETLISVFGVRNKMFTLFLRTEVNGKPVVQIVWEKQNDL